MSNVHHPLCVISYIARARRLKTIFLPSYLLQSPCLPLFFSHFLFSRHTVTLPPTVFSPTPYSPITWPFTVFSLTPNSQMTHPPITNPPITYSPTPPTCLWEVDMGVSPAGLGVCLWSNQIVRTDLQTHCTQCPVKKEVTNKNQYFKGSK